MHLTGRLDDQSRDWSIDRMEHGVVDVLVVGAGITGAGAALDAAARGLAVGLIEQHDLASGTSSRSSKLIHGGLRYLERLELPLVREALRERGLLLHRIAPHLVTGVPFLVPLRHRIWERAYVGAGVALYDRLGGARQLPASRHLSRRSVERLAPGLRSSAYIGGVQFWDAQVDDARYVTSVARTAAAHGAAIATRVGATDLLVEDGRVRGVYARDSESGRAITIRARHVVAAAGPWGDQLLGEVAGRGGLGFGMRPSKGVHLLLPRDAIRAETGVLARTDTGLLFVIPWEGHWLVGDTDTEWSGPPEEAAATEADIAVLLQRLESQFGAPIDASRILGVFAGVRPLVASNPGTDTVNLSREHAIRSPLPGMTTISGGKFTTYRVMAEQLVDAVVRDLGEATGSSKSATTPLIGATGFDGMWRERHRLAERQGMPVARLERLLRRYGTCATDILQLIEERPALGEVVEGADVVIGAEIVYACSHEGARHLDDVLSRRTRVGLLAPDRGEAAIDTVLALMEETLQWEPHVVDDERRDYLRGVAPDRWAVQAAASTVV